MQRSALAGQLDAVVRYACPRTAGGRVNTVAADYPWLSANTVNLLTLEQFAGGGCSWASLPNAETDPEVGWQALTQLNSPFVVTMDFGNSRNPPPADIGPQVSAFPELNAIDVAVLERARRSGRYSVVRGFRREGLVLLRQTQP